MVYLAKKGGGVVHHTSLEAMREMDGIESPEMTVSDAEFEAAECLARIGADGRIFLGSTDGERARRVADARVAELKALLAATDYVAAKIAEGSATAKEYADKFYRVARDRFGELAELVLGSLLDRRLHERLSVVYKNPQIYGEVERAWAFWYLANASFNNSLISGLSVVKLGKTARKLMEKRGQFTREISERLAKVGIENRDALDVVRRLDATDTFFYLDPPYVGANQGHYAGYTQEDFDALLSLLEGIKGKFLLSSYRNAVLREFVGRNRWCSTEIATNHPSRVYGRVEVLTANFPFKIKLNGKSKKGLMGAEAATA